MSELSKMSAQGVQASITAGLGTFCSATCIKFLPEEHVQYGIVVTSLVVPLVAFFMAKFFYYHNESQELIDYKARLSRDAKKQKKFMADKSLTEDVKQQIRSKYSETILKLSTANQDYQDKGLEFTEE